MGTDSTRFFKEENKNLREQKSKIYASKKNEFGSFFLGFSTTILLKPRLWVPVVFDVFDTKRGPALTHRF